MEDLEAKIQAGKARLDALRPLRPGALEQLRHYYDVELTFTSNAIEGNTLTHRETAELIEHGVTVGGKPLRDHLEAEDHYQAVQWMRAVAVDFVPLDETTATELHRRIVARSRPAIAGLYSSHARRVAGSPVVFPNPAKLPELMRAFGDALRTAPSTPNSAFDAHFRLTAIHPFDDGNGRAARLLMNLMLIRGGYPPVAVRPQDRREYLAALEHGSMSGDLQDFQTLMQTRLEATLAEYVAALDPAVDGADAAGAR